MDEYLNDISASTRITVNSWLGKLIKEEFNVKNIVYKYRKEYYHAIAISGGKNGCTPFIEFILGVIDETLSIEKNIPQTTRDKIRMQIRNNPKITRNELADLLGLTSDGIKYHLQKMTKDGIITHRGSTRNGYWEVIDDFS